MRPLTMMMAQKKPIRKQGTALTFSEVIPSRLPAQSPNQCVFYGMAKQNSIPGHNLFKWKYDVINTELPGFKFADNYFINTLEDDLYSFCFSAAHKVTELDIMCYFEDGTSIKKSLMFSNTKAMFSIRNNYIYFNSTGSGNPYYTLYSKIVKFELNGYGNQANGWILSENSESDQQIMLNSGSTPIPYEPYCGGTPSPNFDYPQIVQRVEGTGSVEGNLSPVAVMEFARYATNIKSDTPYSELITALQSLTPGKQYIMSWDYVSNGSIANNYNMMAVYDSQNAVIGYIRNGTTFTAYSDVNFVIACNGVGCTQATWSNIMLESGTVAHTYQPYNTPSALTIPPLYGIEFHDGIHDNIAWTDDDNVTHYAVADTYEPCVWVGGEYRSRITNRIGVKVFDGTENIKLWGANADQTAFYFVTTSYFDMMYDCERLFSTHFSRLPYAEIRGGALGIGAAAKNIAFGISTSDLPTQTAEAFKDLLAAQYAANTPVTVYYILDTPVVTLGDPVFASTEHGTTNIVSSSAVQGQIAASVLQKRY